MENPLINSIEREREREREGPRSFGWAHTSQIQSEERDSF